MLSILIQKKYCFFFSSEYDNLGTQPNLQALVYDILPPTTAITDYAIGLEKLSANEQDFVAAQMAVGL